MDKIVKYSGLIFLFIGLYLVLSNVPMFMVPAISSGASLVLVLVTGLLVSVHCVGMCGGFVIAYSTSGPEKSRMDRVKQHSLYNISRLASYTFFGALAGLIGSVFLLTSQFRGYLSIVAGVFMILYGLSTFIPALRRITTIRTPSPTNYAKGRGPVIFGLLSGMMPCGPLQAMLIFAAASGGALEGATIMFVFALGTIPLMFGFGNAISFLTHKHISRIMAISAIVVMTLGLITLDRGLLLNGYSLPFSGASLFAVTNSTDASMSGNVQVIGMTADNHMWNPSSFTVKKGVPVIWNIQVGKLSDSFMGIRVPQMGISEDFNVDDENVTLSFTPNETGTIIFTCPMGANEGKITVE